MFKRLVAVAALVMVSATSVTPAGAADRHITLTRDNTHASWQGKTGSGFVIMNAVAEKVPDCVQGVNDCETTLLQLDEAGSVRIDTSPGPNSSLLLDVDLYVYRSDEAGAQGTLVASSEGPTAEEWVRFRAYEPGHYLVVVSWYLGVGDYYGTVRFFPFLAS